MKKNHKMSQKSEYHSLDLIAESAKKTEIVPAISRQLGLPVSDN